jgi:hypothetical protein
MLRRRAQLATESAKRRVRDLAEDGVVLRTAGLDHPTEENEHSHRKRRLDDRGLTGAAASP